MLKFVFAKTGRYTVFEVEHYQLRRIIRSVLINIKYQGLVSTALGTVATVSRRLGFPLLQNFLFSQQSGVKDWLEVSGSVEQEDLDVPIEKRGSAVRYEPTPEFELRYVLDHLKISYEEYNFIDYGSGKGLALAVAASYPFRAVTGIEFSEQLHLIAEKNIKEIKQRYGNVCSDITSQCCNAMTYELPEIPHVIFLFNPFGADIVQVVLDRIASDLADVEQPIYFLYNNPMQQETVEKHGFFKNIARPMGGKWRVYSTKPDL